MKTKVYSYKPLHLWLSQSPELWYNGSMNTTKYSFVVLLEYVNLTLEDLNTFNLSLDPDESDLELGYFTVRGDPESILDFKRFMNT